MELTVFFGKRFLCGQVSGFPTRPGSDVGSCHHS